MNRSVFSLTIGSCFGAEKMFPNQALKRTTGEFLAMNQTLRRGSRLANRYAAWKSFSTYVVLALSFAPVAALAEVSEKVVSIPQLWIQCGALGLLGMFVAMRRFAFGIALLPLSLFVAWSGHATLAAPYIGPALMAEQGMAFGASTYGSAALMLFLHGMGLVFRWRRLRPSGGGHGTA